MNTCAAESCTNRATLLTPVSLCTPCAIETALAILPVSLGKALMDSRETATSETAAPHEPLVPTDLERAAVTALRVTNTPIGRRTIEHAIRSLGGKCSSDRGAALARWARNGSDLVLFNTEIPLPTSD
jgi:hypothetical protein